MPRIKRLPLPDPFTLDVAVQRLYMALTNHGRGQLHQIALTNPRMVDALFAHGLREQSDAYDEQKETLTGILPGIGSFRLSRLSDGTGVIDIEIENAEETHHSRLPREVSGG
jgi:hypothetical protein